jgi:hypothetical protein
LKATEHGLYNYPYKNFRQRAFNLVLRFFKLFPAVRARINKESRVKQVQVYKRLLESRTE